ncbi:flagellar hook-associated protein 3 [Salinispira pacifica]|uniref:Flagellar hook-associated protein FlgL n=1 Tax=Salinispira pacifica TaxID=1307761 RepID=V5WG87_9SPIO|nr:flagellar hook-associated protein 3 [Salinispira pacifica]AHC14630.1 Flagellar hook-associated protein FlgL [Salinispira pacifica]
MHRISTNLPNDNLQFHTRNRQVRMNEAQNRMAAQTRILNLRDDPAAAAHATRQQSYLTRLERFSDNIENSMEHYRTAEGHIRHGVDILQEIRQIAVMGGNGTYSKDDLSAMGRQVDELLQEFISSANARDGEGNSIFSGDRTQNLPYRVVEGRIPGMGGTVVTDVEYIGNIGQRKTEVADGKYIELNFPGNQVFWAENQQLYAETDAQNYVVQADSAINVNGTEISLREGDNVYQVISKINDSGAEVKARLDPVSNSLVMETTTPRQLWLADENGSVLQDLGILQDGDSRPPQNISRDARQFGGSAFDAIIRLRDNLYQGDTIDIGGDGLRSIDSALNNMLSNLGSVGAKTSRMELAFKRTEKEIVDVSDRASRLTDIDLTQAITEFAMLEQTHQAALSVAADVMQTTLLDFLR